jgi:hypothetical protein
VQRFSMGCRTWLTAGLLLLSACGDDDPAKMQGDHDASTEEGSDAAVDAQSDKPAEPPVITKVRVTPTSGLKTTESGETASFTVELTAEPTAPVTILLYSSDENEGTADVEKLTFDKSNWGPQKVLVQGRDDHVPDGSRRYQIVLDEAVSDDLRYQSVPVSDVTLTNVDDDAPGITFLHDENPSTDEAGGQSTLQVQLNTRPSAPVTLTLVSSAADEGSVSPEVLTFLPRDWNTPQNVLVTGVNDDEQDGDVQYDVHVSSAVSADLDYLGLVGASLTLLNLDDDTVGIYVEDGSSGDMSIHEDWNGSMYLRLTSMPTDTVTLRCSSSDPEQLTVSPSWLTFYPDSWSEQQWLTLNTKDPLDDGDHTATVTCQPAESSDPAYDGLVVEDRTFTIVDDDVSEIQATVTGQGRTCESSISTDFCCVTVNVALGATATSDVQLVVTSSDPGEGKPDVERITLRDQRYGTKVKVCGVDDAEDDGDVNYTLTIAIESTSDALFAAAPPAVIALINRDND